MRFSIILACEHSAEFLATHLEALRNLDFPAEQMEVIVVDDLQREGREAVVATAVKQGLQAKHIAKQGIGLAAARNLAIRESAGEFLAFLEDDCIPPRKWLRLLEEEFRDPQVGAVGGPDRAPANISLFARSADCVLTSYFGTLGMRTGRMSGSGYVPRPWNMAVRRECAIRAGCFDEKHPESPEAPLAANMQSLGYRIVFQPKTEVEHHREMTLRQFLSRDFRLAMERARKPQQGIAGKAYMMASLVFIGFLGLAGTAPVWPVSAYMVVSMAGAYALALGAHGAWASATTRRPLAGVYVPFILATHHGAHITGYIYGRLVPKREER